jgi:hypothetical protein
MNMPNNRFIVVALEVNGHQNSDGTIEHRANDPSSLQYSYRLATSSPPATGPLVASNGDLDLGYLPQNPGDPAAVDIHFIVSGSITGNAPGSIYPIHFAEDTDFNPDDPTKQKGYCWRVNNEQGENPIPWPGKMSTQRSSDTEVVIMDGSPQNNSPPYYYCLGTKFTDIDQLGAPRSGSYYYLTFDPKIVRG